MKNMELNHCPSTLAKGFNAYSPTAIKNLFKGHKVKHILPMNPPQLDEEVAEAFRQNRKILSISGVQVKQSFRLKKNEIVITQEGEQGEYILKPIPHRETLARINELPANEHLTMQIATQVYKMNVAKNALIFFKNEEPAYLTKRFDLSARGEKIDQEDFATLMGRTKDLQGSIYKNEGSYEEMASVMKKYVSAYMVEVEKFFSLVLFNYLFSNGDAHLKNFSLQITINGDYILTPAYDLLNTKIHIKDDTSMALTDGLFKDDFGTESFRVNGYYAYDDFYEFGLKIGVSKPRTIRILDKYRPLNKQVQQMINRSFLSPKIQSEYMNHYFDRNKRLNYSFLKRI